MYKLIIQHGDRVTEHEIGEHPLIVGRDPQCDLFFADKKLSRRHARFEREGKDLRLVDLGSRNGSWVNDERVEIQLVTAGDSMRLGSLLISLLAEDEPEEDSTVYLTAEPAGSDESQTVMLSSEALSAATPAHDANKVVEDAGSHGTVMLSSEALSAAAPVHDATKVVEEAGSDESQTVMLSSEALSAAAPVHDATKVVEEAGSDESQTVMLSSEALSAAAPAHDANKVVEDAGSDESQTVMLSSEALSAAAPAHDANKVVEDAGSDESQTVMLSSEALSAAAPVHDANKVVEEAGSDESGTVMLSSEALSAAASGARKNDANEAVEDAEDAGTMILQTTDTLRPVEQEDAPEDPPTLSQPESDSTVMLESAMPLTDAKTGAVIFRGKVDPSLQAATRIVSPDSLRESFDEARADYGSGSVENVSNEPSSASETRVGRGSPGSFRFVALVAAIAILAVAVLALPLMRILGSALTTESSHRARALVYLLAATNVAALSQSPPGARSLEHVIDEPGVVAAYILDPSGNLLAPEGGDLSSLPADALEDAAGLPALLTRDLRNGDVLIMTPITGDGRRMGVAVLQFRPQTVTSWSTIMLVIGALLLLVGVGVAVLLARRWTLGPLRDLRDDVLALREGLPGTLPEERPYSELSDLARSFNELLEQSTPPRDDAARGLDATVIRER